MSAHRDLIRARDALIEAAGAWARTVPHPDGRMFQAKSNLREAVAAYEELAADPATDGAASARHTSIAASKNLSTVTSWRGKVQRAVFNAGKTYPPAYPDVDGAPSHLGGITCDELERKLGSYGHSAHHGSISSAVNWCEKAGWIKDSGHTRETRAGNKAIVYEPTEKLIEKCAEERRVA